MLSYIGLMRDPRARKDMVPDEVWARMPPDPEIVALEAERTGELMFILCDKRETVKRERIRLSYEERTFQYYRPTVIYDYFDRVYAKHISVFEYLDHFKNHVERIYGVKLRA
ncbi:hypothetical protein GE09DRAFT_1108627 [Coniochaeta sp. 2T2.1]|nr:hypothetical protein GE09DRAFT_1108627 [Coniochaeta sp. 2T2.1]